ncbi:class I SAM-dependent methyltransferase [soil metagenome]
MGFDNDPYDQIAEFYDLEHDHLVDDVEMYLQFVESVGDPVLELACGTGRVAVPIAEAGFRVTGIDRSESMLDRARKRATRSSMSSTAEFKSADMVDAGSVSGGPFGLVIMALGALSHLATQELQLSALRSARNALDPRGLLLVDVFHASPSRLQTLDGGVGMDGAWTLPDGTEIERFSTHSVHPASQTIQARIWYETIDSTRSVRRASTQMTQRYVSPGELRLMLDHAGFKESVLYGGYDLEPFEDTSDRLIVAAEATKTR